MSTSYSRNTEKELDFSAQDAKLNLYQLLQWKKLKRSAWELGYIAQKISTM